MEYVGDVVNFVTALFGNFEEFCFETLKYVGIKRVGKLLEIHAYGDRAADYARTWRKFKLKNYRSNQLIDCGRRTIVKIMHRKSAVKLIRRTCFSFSKKRLHFFTENDDWNYCKKRPR